MHFCSLSLKMSLKSTHSHKRFGFPFPTEKCMLYALRQVRWLKEAEGEDKLGPLDLHRNKREQARATWCVLVGVNSQVPA